MRKFLTISALLCLAFLIGGYHLLYQCRLAEVKSAMKAELARKDKSKLIQLVLSPAEMNTVAWENATEFSYKGQMFDAVTVESKDGKTICWCLPDEDETALIEQYLKTHDSSSDKDPSHSLFKLLKVPFLPSSVELSKRVSFKNRGDVSIYLLRLSSANIDVNSPPPKGC